jgi:carbon storage regulator
MLILTRRIGEKLVIGEKVTVTILGVKGNQVSMGIEAPVEIKIHREEIFRKIQAEKNPTALTRKKMPIAKKKTAAATKTRETLVLKSKKRIIGL